MDLKTMLYERLSSSAELNRVLATYNGHSAVFYQQAPSSEDALWSEAQYPRLDYIVDMQENPARNASGVAQINVWCDVEQGAAPEEIDSILKELLHATFAQTDDYPYCFAWVRSDTFEVKTQGTETARTIGVTVIFDVMACPSHATMYPDPITALGAWTKSTLPDAIVVGLDEMQGWIVPTKEKPVVYWRLASMAVSRRHFAYVWLDAGVEGHVYARTAADRLYNLVRLNTAYALSAHITMEDGSPMFLRSYTCKPHLNYVSQGQIAAVGQFGILQPEKHLSNASTGKDLLTASVSIERS